MITAGVIRGESINAVAAVSKREAAVFAAVLAKPTSRGRVLPRTDDPLSTPQIDLELLSTPEDVRGQRQVVRGAYQIVADATVWRHFTEFSLGGSIANNDHSLDEWILQNVRTGYHACSTCRMGPDGDPSAVVDQHLRVRGVANLFIADASVMPVIPTGFTNLPCFMIGERAADLLRLRDRRL